MSGDVSSALLKVFEQQERFLVIGLTGRTGSGCSTAAELLSREFDSIPLPASKTNSLTPDDRKLAIVKRFAEPNWHPFFRISVSDVILSFLLEEDQARVQAFLEKEANATEVAVALEGFSAAQTEWRRVAPSVGPMSNLDANAASDLLSVFGGSAKAFFTTFRRQLGSSVPKILQKLGDELRKSGTPFDGQESPEKLFATNWRVVAIARAHHRLCQAAEKPTHVVIDAIRNPFEAAYLRNRLSGFYLMAITTDDKDRVERLQRKDYSKSEIAALDQKEYPDKNKPLSGYGAFVSQNIQSCLERADIFVRNPGLPTKDGEPDLRVLAGQLVRYVALMQHPGLVTPTAVERCMQVAFVAKANSGCISRQVGAAITDGSFSVKAIGWNDVPAGQVPCSLRTANDLITKQDEAAFSQYELSTKAFSQQIKKSFKGIIVLHRHGRSSQFCFKDEYNAIKGSSNQIHTRSLHAEENAFLQLSKHGGTGILGGNLFSTASPCELCAKKAFQLGIKRIVYIDPYPGISSEHILASGDPSSRPILELFTGAVGSAYHRLYDGILPLKDELNALVQASDMMQNASQLPLQPAARTD